MGESMIEIQKLSVGAEVIGLHPGDESDPGVKKELYRAWLEYGFLLFRNVSSIEHHLSLSRCFGDLEIHPIPQVRSALHPMLIDIGGKKRGRAYVYDEGVIRVN
jgi:taurine dioxygenase